VLCKSCGLGRIVPLATSDQLLAYYSDEYRFEYKKAFEPRLRHVYRAARAALVRYAWMEPFLKPGMRVLEIGCGGGELAFLLRSRGYLVVGVEPHRGYGEYARRELGLNIYCGPLETFSPPEGTLFDVATLFHVLEHVSDPVAFLKGAAKHLHPEGLIFIEVPIRRTRAGHPARRFHRAHTLYFDRITLRAACRAAGFEQLSEYQSEDGGNIGTVQRWTGTSDEITGLISGNYRQARIWEARHRESSYFLQPLTWQRFAKRWLNFGREYLAARQARDRRSMLESLYRSAKLHRPATAPNQDR
jgi:SAM-dependent methyltransferase